ncbi:hypothetical protein Tco_0408013 [Tanacetum coccineum]
MEELTATVMLMAQIQPADGNAKTVPSYDAKAVSEVNASSKVHNQMSHVKSKTIIHTSDDDQIDSNIIFDDPFVENNHGTSEHDSNAHDEYNKTQMLAYNVQREAKNKKRLNNELKKQKELLQKELETCKDRVKTFDSRTIQSSKYKKTCEELERELKAHRSKQVTSHPIPKNEQSKKQSANVIARGMYRITKIETQTSDSKANIHVSNSKSVESSNSVSRPKSKGTKLKNRVLKNTKSSYAYVWKISSSVSIDSNKCETKDLNVCQTNASVSNSKNVNGINDGSNIVCVSYGKDMFLLSHEKCVARYALSRNSNVKEPYSLPP